MDPESNRQVVREYVAAFHRGDLDGLVSLLWSDAQRPGVLAAGGLEKAASLGKPLIGGLGIHLMIEEMIPDGDTVAVRDTERGVFAGPFLGPAPTGQSHERVAMEGFAIRDGKNGSPMGRSRWRAPGAPDGLAVALTRAGRGGLAGRPGTTKHRRHLSNPLEMLMAEYPIAVIVGSLRRDSFNRKLANALVTLAPPEFSFQPVEIGGLPLYNQDDDTNPAESVKRLKADIAAARGLLFVTPEYNRSIPGVLKNALDHASRPYGQNAWQGKPAGVIGVSVGAIGTALAQQHLRNVLAYLDVPTLGQPEAFLQAKAGLFDEAGHLGAASQPFLQDWMNSYGAWVKQHAAGSGPEQA